MENVLAMWSAQDYDTPDELPYIGRISDRSNIYVAAGFRKWGLSNGTLAGMLIRDLIALGSCAMRACIPGRARISRVL